MYFKQPVFKEKFDILYDAYETAINTTEPKSKTTVIYQNFYELDFALDSFQSNLDYDILDRSTKQYQDFLDARKDFEHEFSLHRSKTFVDYDNSVKTCVRCGSDQDF